MLDYVMSRVFWVGDLERELEAIYGREFHLRRTILEPPANDCYLSFDGSEYPISKEDAEEYFEADYREDYNFTCEYLKSIGLLQNGESVIIDIMW